MVGSGSKLRRRSVFDRSGSRSGPMMTPMVDVVLVILIFFMASTTIAGYEWFLRAGVEAAPKSKDPDESARFVLPAAVIEIDLVRSSDGTDGDGTTMVYGIGGEGGMTLGRAIEMIGAMEVGELGALTVSMGAGDDVPMGDVMAVHDAWNALGDGNGEGGVKVVMRTGR